MKFRAYFVRSHLYHYCYKVWEIKNSALNNLTAWLPYKNDKLWTNNSLALTPCLRRPIIWQAHCLQMMKQGSVTNPICLAARCYSPRNHAEICLPCLSIKCEMFAGALPSKQRLQMSWWSGAIISRDKSTPVTPFPFLIFISAKESWNRRATWDCHCTVVNDRAIHEAEKLLIIAILSALSLAMFELVSP